MWLWVPFAVASMGPSAPDFDILYTLSECPPPQKILQDPKMRKEVEDRIRLGPMILLESVIHRDLTKRKTAFVSPLHLFQSDWNLFQEAMRLDSRYRFTRFQKSEKMTTLKGYKMYEFAKNLHPMHMHIPRRLKAVFSSGIRELWRKWKNFKHTF